MSRIGNQPIELPEGVDFKLDGTTATVNGKNGELTRELSSDIELNIEDNVITFTRKNDSKRDRKSVV